LACQFFRNDSKPAHLSCSAGATPRNTDGQRE
jgi:hypothetical protein